MVDVKNITDVTLSQNEYGFLVGKQYYANSTFAITIPKLMPNVTKPNTEPFNRNILVNAKDCKPSVGNSIKVQNYITVKRSPNCTLLHKAGRDYIVPSGTRVECLCTNNNYKNIQIIDAL